MVNRHGMTGIAACLAVVIASCETPKPTASASEPAAKIAAAQSAWDAPPLSIPGNLHVWRGGWHYGAACSCSLRGRSSFSANV